MTKSIRDSIWIFVLLAATVLFFLPIIWLFSSTFRDVSEFIKYPGRLFPESFSVANYFKVFEMLAIGRSYANSFTIAVGSTVGVVITSSAAAYALAKVFVKGTIAASKEIPFHVTRSVGRDMIIVDGNALEFDPE